MGQKFQINGMQGCISTGECANGDLSLRGSGNSWFLATARSVARDFNGTWNGVLGSWVIIKQRKHEAISQLSDICRPADA